MHIVYTLSDHNDVVRYVGFTHLSKERKLYHIRRELELDIPTAKVKWLKSIPSFHYNEVLTCLDDAMVFQYVLPLREQYKDTLVDMYIPWDPSPWLANHRPNTTKRVAQYTMAGELVAIYDSGVKASRATGIHQSIISAVATGKSKTAKGWVFKFI